MMNDKVRILYYNLIGRDHEILLAHNNITKLGVDMGEIGVNVLTIKTSPSLDISWGRGFFGTYFYKHWLLAPSALIYNRHTYRLYRKCIKRTKPVYNLLGRL